MNSARVSVVMLGLCFAVGIACGTPEDPCGTLCEAQVASGCPDKLSISTSTISFNTTAECKSRCEEQLEKRASDECFVASLDLAACAGESGGYDLCSGETNLEKAGLSCPGPVASVVDKCAP